jgi:hypothetical protein
MAAQIKFDTPENIEIAFNALLDYVKELEERLNRYMTAKDLTGSFPPSFNTSYFNT